MKLRTIGLISTLAIGLLAGPLSVEAQRSGKVYRIGFLSDSPRMRPNFEVFRQGLRELGYIEGQSLSGDLPAGSPIVSPRWLPIWSAKKSTS